MATQRWTGGRPTGEARTRGEAPANG
jgi:hypothetical protein